MSEFLSDPNAPEYAPIRGELSRLFIRHKASMEMGQVPDDAIAENVSVICAGMITLCRMAQARKDYVWLTRHKWFLDACDRMLDGESAVPLDG